ncbi:MAG TPA: hypothetical protein VIG24_16945 [Acidimicrobiia bacterium]
MSDHHQFLARQCAVNRLAFGPGERRLGVLDHILQEVEEVKKAENSEARAGEWIDLVLLSQDGMLRATREMLREGMAEYADHPMIVRDGVVVGRFGEPTADYVAEVALAMLTGKRDKNELREWDDWRAVGENAAVNHKEGSHD